MFYCSQLAHRRRARDTDKHCENWPRRTHGTGAEDELTRHLFSRASDWSHNSLLCFPCRQILVLACCCKGTHAAAERSSKQPTRYRRIPARYLTERAQTRVSPVLTVTMFEWLLHVRITIRHGEYRTFLVGWSWLEVKTGGGQGSSPPAASLEKAGPELQRCTLVHARVLPQFPPESTGPETLCTFPPTVPHAGHTGYRGSAKQVQSASCQQTMTSNWTPLPALIHPPVNEFELLRIVTGALLAW